MEKGIIKKSTGSNYEVLLLSNAIISAKTKGKLRLDTNNWTNPIAVGDEVDVEKEANSDSWMISKIYPRYNYLIRKSNNLSRRAQIIASNIDYALIFVTIIQPRTSFGFIDRILATLEAYHITPIIIFNKIDLYKEDTEAFQLWKEMENLYESIGYTTFSISALYDIVTEEIVELIKNKKCMVTGHSGAGKSSFLKCLSPNSSIKVGEISKYSQKGIHTTTFAEMHIIDNQYYIIDTPGIKDFGLYDMNSAEISHFFPEMRSLLGQCKFSNCQHINEPNCKVIEAVLNNQIHFERYKSYLSMVENIDNHH